MCDDQNQNCVGSQVVLDGLENNTTDVEVKKSWKENVPEEAPRNEYGVKHFVARKSVLTHLFRTEQSSFIYHVFIAVLMYMCASSVVSELVRFGRFTVGTELIAWNFSKLPEACVQWLAMQATALVMYLLFLLWAKRGPQDKTGRMCWDTGFLLLLLLYLMAFLVLPCAYVVVSDFPIAVSLALLMEQMRFLMKMHGFIRTNAPRVKSEGVFPTFRQYIYFLFAPTLIYKDEYPRNPHVRWSAVVQHFAEVVGIVFYFSLIMEIYLRPAMDEVIATDLTSLRIADLLVKNVLPSSLAFVCGFFGLLHSWQNAFAEMLRFADRLFYRDWWNATTFSEYFKNWNLIVHDWLFAFVYKDTTWLLHRGGSTCLVFLVSAAFHEYCLAFTFRFCYPVLFVVFGIIGFFLPEKLPRLWGNTFLWLALFFGISIVVTLYMMEYHARLRCVSTLDSSIKDFFVPRSWTCYG